MPLKIAMLRPWMVTLVSRLRVFAAVLLIGPIAATTTLPPKATAQQATAQQRAAQQRAAQQRAAAPAKAATTNSVVATVNADPITEKNLADETVRRYGEGVLDGMINRYLILQACQARGIEVTKAEVTEEINRLASKFRLDMNSYLKLLQEERNISPAEYAQDIVWPTLALRRLVADKIEITDEEYNKQYMARYGEAIKCRMIMVGERDKAEAIHGQAAADPSKFEALAKKFSEDESSASVGGLIPPIRRYTSDPDMEQAVFALADGDVSGILPIGDQWMILQAVRRIPAATPPPQTMPLIREQIVDQIRDEKVRVAASELFTRLQADANVTKVLGDSAEMNQHPGVAALINNQPMPISQVADEAVRRHGPEVLEGEINRKLLTQALKKADVAVTSDDLTSETTRAAVAYGFTKPDGSADLDGWIRSVTSDGETTQDIYMRDAVWPSVALRKLVESEVRLTQEDLQLGFESAYGPKVEVLAIVLGDQRTAQKVWQMARDNPTPVFFGELAQRYSIEPSSASNNGMVPPIRKHGGQAAIEKEAFSLKPGELSGIVATGDKYIIMRCQGYTEPVVSDFEAVRGELVRDLTEKKVIELMANKFDSLKDNAEIENFLEIALKSGGTRR